MFEELGFIVQDMFELCTLSLKECIEKYYIYYSPNIYKFTIQGEELNRSNESNIYKPEWISIEKLASINLLPKELKKIFISYFKGMA